MTDFLIAWTLVIATAIVVALAGYLSAIAYYLYRAGGSRRSHLAQLAGGLAAVRDHVAPLERRLAAVATALVALRHELQAVDTSLSEVTQAIRR